MKPLLNALLLKGQLWQGNFHSPADIARARVFYENYVALAVATGASFSPLVWNNIALLREHCGDATGAKTALDEVVRISLASCGVASTSVSALTDEELDKLCTTNLNVTLLFNYAVFAEKHGEEELAARLFAAVLRGVPEYYDCVLHEARLLLKHEKAAEAEAKLKALCDDLEKQLAAGVGVRVGCEQ